MKHPFTLIFVALLLADFTGCNTIGGAGKDISAAGHDVTKVAKKVQKKMANGD